MYTLEAETAAIADTGGAAVIDDSIVVTGSRLRRSETQTSAPMTSFGTQDLTERGYVQVGELLHDVTSNVPDLPINPPKGHPEGSGPTYPQMLHPGAGATLPLAPLRRPDSTAT